MANPHKVKYAILIINLRRLAADSVWFLNLEASS